MNTILTVFGVAVVWVGYGIPISSIIDGCIAKRFQIRLNPDWTYSGYILTIRFYGWCWRKLVMTDRHHEIEVDEGIYKGYQTVLDLIHKHYGKDAKVNIVTWKSRSKRDLVSR